MNILKKAYGFLFGSEESTAQKDDVTRERLNEKIDEEIDNITTPEEDNDDEE